MSAPIEAKVQGATVGGVIAGLIDWALATYAFHHATPGAVQVAVLVLVPTILAFVGGYLPPHTPRSAAEHRKVV